MAGRGFTKRMIAKGVSQMAGSLSDEQIDGLARLFAVFAVDPQTDMRHEIVVRAHCALQAAAVAFALCVEALDGRKDQALYIYTNVTVKRLVEHESNLLVETPEMADARRAYYREHIQ